MTTATIRPEGRCHRNRCDARRHRGGHGGRTVSEPIICTGCQKPIGMRPRPGTTFLCTRCGHDNDNQFDVYLVEPLLSNVVGYAHAVVTTPAGAGYADRASEFGIDPEVVDWDVLVALEFIVWGGNGGWVASSRLPAV